MIIKQKNFLLWLFLLALALRIIFIFNYVDLDKKLESWEYGSLAKNLINGKGYSLIYFESDKIETKYNPEKTPFKSAIMSPGYVYFLLPFYLIKSVYFQNLLILLAQALISSISVILVYKLTKQLFDKKSAAISGLIMAFYPEFIYGVSSITPTVLYHFFVLLLFISLTKYDFTNINYNKTKFLLIGLVFIFLIYLRIEIWLYLIILTFYFLYKRFFSFSVGVILFVVLLYSPWIIRNYLTFETFIPFTTSSGLNFYRGNNPYFIGAWGDEKVEEELLDIKLNDRLELEMSDLFMNESINFIKDKPLIFLENLFKKFFYFCFLNFNDERSYNIFYIVPWMLLLSFSIVGLIKSFSLEKFYFIYLFLFASIFIAVVFFSLPRHQTMMKIALIPFAGFGIKTAYKNILKGDLNTLGK